MIKPNSKRQKTRKKQNINKANLASQSKTHNSKEREREREIVTKLDS